MADAKVIDMEMNEDGVMEEKKSFVKKVVKGIKDHKKEILKTTVKVGAGFICGVAFGYYALPDIVSTITKPETVAQVAEAAVEAAI